MPVQHSDAIIMQQNHMESEHLLYTLLHNILLMACAEKQCER